MHFEPSKSLWFLYTSSLAIVRVFISKTETPQEEI